jgi:molybdopterin-guanine dinucleotide biosynthesis protein A
MDSDLNFDGRKGGEPDDSVFVHAAGFLLAGGRSSRMGRDKALLTLGGEPLIKIGLEKLRVVCSEVAIAGGTEDLARFGRMVPDGRLDCGPLGGIVSALEQSLFEWNLFLPVDTPFVPVTCLKSLLSMCHGNGRWGTSTVMRGVFTEGVGGLASRARRGEMEDYAGN